MTDWTMDVFLQTIELIKYKMKKLIKKLFNSIGLDIIRYKKANRSRKTKNLTLHKTITGNYYLPTDAVNDTVANTIISNEIFEKEVVDLARKYIKPNTTVLDLGANFGQMSILFADMVGENGHVHSFDADDWIFEIFSKNIKANNKTNKITPHFGAIHNIPGETLIFPEQDFQEFGTYGSYGIDYNSRKGREVKTITIDSLNIEEPISFIKIDIQGGDLQAMQGAIKTIEKNKCPILFEYEYHFEEKFNMCFQDYVDFVQSINYKFHKVLSGHNFLIIPK
jgi:FkbM family methyltransferase